MEPDFLLHGKKKLLFGAAVGTRAYGEPSFQALSDEEPTLPMYMAVAQALLGRS